jgi:hypothetical protein
MNRKSLKVRSALAAMTASGLLAMVPTAAKAESNDGAGNGSYDTATCDVHGKTIAAGESDTTQILHWVGSSEQGHYEWVSITATCNEDGSLSYHME